MRRLLFVVLAGWLGCGRGEASLVDWSDDAEQVAGPLLGANGQDAADRSCHVVLRELSRTGTSCGSACWWTFTGFVDLSAQAVGEGGVAYVLYKNIDASSWSRATVTAVSGAPAGFTRYRFELTENTIEDGMSSTAYQRVRLELAPYVLTSTGARLFDHNRMVGDFDNYVVNLASNWSVPADAAVCAPPPAFTPSVEFSVGWQTAQHGALVAGQPFTLRYDIHRVEDCRGTHNGYPAWDITASVRFLPSGEVVEGSVRGFDSPNGVPSNSTAVSVPLDVAIPAGTRSLEVWFKNFTGAGSSCVAWDSNLGANYRFDVEARPFANVVWVGNGGSSFTRACSREDGVPASVVLDSYLWSRACMFIEADAYVPGLTDGAAVKPGALLAQAVTTLDGTERPATWLRFVSRVGNDYRFHYEVPKSDLYYGPKWSTFTYTLRFSTDGVNWVSEPTRTVTRDPSFCNPAWGTCD